ncbi:MAG TPA: hypothetical protein VG167_18860 [Verrucomicrobiae bacterium]|nr:hypothetical protein [Verrucomicrobiae bacterium]
MAYKGHLRCFDLLLHNRPLVKTFIPAAEELESLQKAAISLDRANDAMAEAKRASEAAKETIAKWLRDKREVDIDKLPIGELVHIDDVVMIEIARMRKFDSTLFHSEKPELYQQYQRDLAVKKFKPLV